MHRGRQMARFWRRTPASRAARPSPRGPGMASRCGSSRRCRQVPSGEPARAPRHARGGCFASVTSGTCGACGAIACSWWSWPSLGRSMRESQCGPDCGPAGQPSAGLWKSHRTRPVDRPATGRPHRRQSGVTAGVLRVSGRGRWQSPFPAASRPAAKRGNSANAVIAFPVTGAKTENQRVLPPWATSGLVGYARFPRRGRRRPGILRTTGPKALRRHVRWPTENLFSAAVSL
ncbi:hypothetical protein ADIAG_03294 [Paeniglutamicibacter gangotriensis Lz1y]|uniref:Uncharacterized protein n=1 Tax=Paeniglutamicibacter gangotriensis Lz1y TaxID=1276920 RepID=M7N6V1_9MICC|nr:hypothetical protein ADIAG_03294 [Paeniglutamicibacter gangotriensis Lz1y]